MKRLLYILILFALNSGVLNAQQLQPYHRSNDPHVLVDKNTWSQYFLAPPHGNTPGFPASVPDTLKPGALYNNTALNKLQRYNTITGQWEPVTPDTGFFSRNFQGLGTRVSPYNIADTLKMGDGLDSYLIHKYGLGFQNTSGLHSMGANGDLFRWGTDTARSLTVAAKYVLITGYPTIFRDTLRARRAPLNIYDVLRLGDSTRIAGWAGGGLPSQTGNSGKFLTTNGTTASWATVTAGLTSSNFITGEVPSGTVNGSNVTFTLANTPTSGTVKIFQNGLRDKNTVDYTISGSTITFTVAPLTGDLLLIDYLK